MSGNVLFDRLLGAHVHFWKPPTQTCSRKLDRRPGAQRPPLLLDSDWRFECDRRAGLRALRR